MSVRGTRMSLVERKKFLCSIYEEIVDELNVSTEKGWVRL
jgi:hypothetical protein